MSNSDLPDNASSPSSPPSPPFPKISGGLWAIKRAELDAAIAEAEAEGSLWLLEASLKVQPSKGTTRILVVQVSGLPDPSYAAAQNEDGTYQGRDVLPFAPTSADADGTPDE